MFDKLYSHYKDSWDYEMKLRNANMTYKQAEKKARKQEEWVPAQRKVNYKLKGGIRFEWIWRRY